MNQLEKANNIKLGKNLEPVELLKPISNHQVLAANWMKSIEQGLILDDAGVGKTISTLGFFKLLSSTKNIKAAVFAPTAVVHQWISEINEFLGWKIINPSGSKDRRQIQYSFFDSLTENAILVTNYSTPKVDLQYFKNMNFDVIIYDESTVSCHPETELFNSLNLFGSKAKYQFGLTGTPVGLSLKDIYWQLKLVNMKTLKSIEEETIDYIEVEKTKSIRGVVKTEIGFKNLDKFKERIEPFTLRRKLEDILESKESMEFLPETTTTKPTLKISPVKYSKEQSELFNILKQEANRQSRTNTYNALGMYNQFLRSCSFPSLVDSLGIYSDLTPKTEFILNYTKEMKGKLVIFVRFLDSIKILSKVLENNHQSVLYLSGKENQNDKSEEILKRFNNPEGPKVLIITGVGKYGLNLQCATNFIFFDIPYNPLDVIQYIRRIYRIGQKDKTEVNILFTESTVEEDIIRKLFKRMDLLDSILDTKTFNFTFNSDNYVKGFLEKTYQ